MLLSLLSRRSLEVDSRDAYGFALRPHHLQKYKEYIAIYKEEETERVVKWDNFLAWQDKSKEDHTKTVQAEVSGVKEETTLEKVGEGTDLSDDSRECKPKKEVQHLEEINLEKDVQLPKESEPRKEVQHPRECEPEKEVQVQEESEPIKLVQLPEERGNGSEEELPKRTKTRNIQTWAQTRESLCAIENIMSFRIKKGKHMKDKLQIENKDFFPSIKEEMSSEKESEDNFEKEMDVNDMSGDKLDASTEECDTNISISPEPFCHWKEELEVLVHGGVPKELRGEVWQAFVGVKARRMERYYQDLLAEVTNADKSTEHDDDTSGVPRKWKRQIEKDIPRTFPGHPALDDYGRDSLRRILLAYARHNPTVGYCQAMNFFAGLLLLLMPEENAFWTFVGVIDDYFDGYYTEEMIESQVDQLVFEELMREKFPKLVSHLDDLGVQVPWISGPWFLSIFVNMLPWESVLRIWDVLLFEGNRVMLFRIGLALMELYGHALVTTKDAGDAITLLQSLAGSTFDSSQLVLTACMGYLAVTEARLQELREKHRPAIIQVVEERSQRLKASMDSKEFVVKHASGSSVEGKDETAEKLVINSKEDSLPDLQEQVARLKVEMCRLLEEKRSAILRAENLETALMEMVKEDNRKELNKQLEQLEQEVAELRQLIDEKREREAAMLQVLMHVEQEQRVSEEARKIAEHDAAAQKYAIQVLQEKYEKAMSSIAQMENKVVMAESMLEATLQYQSGQAKASSPRSICSQGAVQDSPRRMTSLLPFGFGRRDKNKGKEPEEADDSKLT